jgi:aminodeoxyfutalosine deaminase
MPKSELHLHLEGSVRPETLSELDPTIAEEELRRIYSYADFGEFLKAFAEISKRLRKPEHYALITRRLLGRLTAQNVRYAEITLSAGVVLWKRQEFGPIFDAVRDATVGFPVEVCWILDAVRQFGPEHAFAVAKLAAERVGGGVVAFGIGGDEVTGPAEWFTDVFAYAKNVGLHVLAHAGETAGPQSVWAALRLGAERIGHGIAAIQDPHLIRYLREHDIPLEICITSNLATGAVRRLEEHPLRRLYDAGVPIVLSTDDPGMFRCDLVDEYELAARCFGFSHPELQAIAENGFRYAFR